MNTAPPPNPDSFSYWLRLAIAFDEFCNVLFGGYLDETISARAGRAAYHGKLWGTVLASFLGWIAPEHCREAELHDEQRARFIVWLEQQNDPAAKLTRRLLVR